MNNFIIPNSNTAAVLKLGYVPDRSAQVKLTGRSILSRYMGMCYLKTIIVQLPNGKKMQAFWFPPNSQTHGPHHHPAHIIKILYILTADNSHDYYLGHTTPTQPFRRKHIRYPYHQYFTHAFHTSLANIYVEKDIYWATKIPKKCTTPPAYNIFPIQIGTGCNNILSQGQVLHHWWPYEGGYSLQSFRDTIAHRSKFNGTPHIFYLLRPPMDNLTHVHKQRIRALSRILHQTYILQKVPNNYATFKHKNPIGQLLNNFGV